MRGPILRVALVLALAGCSYDFAALEGHSGSGGQRPMQPPANGTVGAGPGGGAGSRSDGSKPAAAGSGGQVGGVLVGADTGGATGAGDAPPATGGTSGAGGIGVEGTGSGGAGGGSAGAGTGGDGPAPGGGGAGNSMGGETTGGAAGGGVAGMGGAAMPDTANYNFESSNQAWGMGTGSPGTFTSVGRSTTQHFAGQASLAASLTAPAAPTHFILEVNPPVPTIPADTMLTFHLYVPRSAVLTAVVPYALEAGNNYRFDNNFVVAASLARDAWTTVRVTVPADATTILRLGVRFEFAGAWTGTVYLDSIDW